MLYYPSSSAPPTGGQDPAGKTVNGQQKRALNKLLRDLVAFTGTAITDLAAKPKVGKPKQQPTRLLYRRADTLTEADHDRLVVEVGAAPLMAALDRATQPPLPFMVAAE